MSVYGRVVIECDTKGCQAEQILDAHEFASDMCNWTKGAGIDIEFYAAGWRVDEDAKLHCPQCVEEGK